MTPLQFVLLLRTKQAQQIMLVHRRYFCTIKLLPGNGQYQADEVLMVHLITSLFFVAFK